MTPCAVSHHVATAHHHEHLVGVIGDTETIVI
jgi:hypothetical protein